MNEDELTEEWIASKVKKEPVDPVGRIVNKRTETVNEEVTQASLSNVVEFKGKNYVKQTKLVRVYQIVTTVFEMEK